MTAIMESVRRLITQRRPVMVTNYENERFEIQAELDDISAELGGPAPPADVDALIQRRAVLQEKLRIIAGRQAAEQAAYRTKLQERQAAFRRDLDADLGPLRELLPRLRYHLAGVALLEDRLEEGGAPWEDLTAGLPFGAAARLNAAISREVAGSDTWDECFTPSAVARLLDAGREYARRKAATAQGAE
jgi:hypothetical protein